jgi:hypothetical protein
VFDVFDVLELLVLPTVYTEPIDAAPLVPGGTLASGWYVDDGFGAFTLAADQVLPLPDLQQHTALKVDTVAACSSSGT